MRPRDSKGEDYLDSGTKGWSISIGRDLSICIHAEPSNRIDPGESWLYLSKPTWDAIVEYYKKTSPACWEKSKQQHRDNPTWEMRSIPVKGHGIASWNVEVGLSPYTQTSSAVTATGKHYARHRRSQVVRIAQVVGEVDCLAAVIIPRKDFEKLTQWYEKDAY